MREGYEGLVRGNIDAPKRKVVFDSAKPSSSSIEEDEEDRLINNLRFGDGGLLREGEGDAVDHPGGRSLKGRYIIRVGWDDVRGWFAEVTYQFLSSSLVILPLTHPPTLSLREEPSSEQPAPLRSALKKAVWPQQTT